MTVFDILTMIGGLCLFLFGMNVMGSSLEKTAGGKLEIMLGRLTTGKIAGFLTGLGVTSVIQSSSATTVMVVGFVNSGLMSLGQAINVIMGANVGTTVTAWILSLCGISGDNIFVQLLKPTSFTPVLALIGIVLYMFTKSSKKKEIGMILLGFATLMFGMDAMTGAVEPLKDEAWFTELFTLFENPILGLLAGAVLTAIVQSSSASVGILQALSMTGAVSYGSVIPIIMGQNIGTCVTALIASVGTNKNARRAALVHLSFNVIGATICLGAFCIAGMFIPDEILGTSVTHAGIAVAHSVFNILCTMILLPASSLLEKLAYKLIPETKTPDSYTELDERLLANAAVAIERSEALVCDMANAAKEALCESVLSLKDYTRERAARIRELEEKSDHYEDIISTYLVKLTSRPLSERESAEVTKLLKVIGDFERISDHAVNILESAEELRDKSITLTADAESELSSMCDAVLEIVDISTDAFVNNLPEKIYLVEPLEAVIDRMKEYMRTGHIKRLSAGKCSVEAGFVLSDLLTNLERVSDHCSNIAGCVSDSASGNMDLHRLLRSTKNEYELYDERYREYASKYMGAEV